MESEGVSHSLGLGLNLLCENAHEMSLCDGGKGQVKVGDWHVLKRNQNPFVQFLFFLQTYCI